LPISCHTSQLLLTHFAIVAALAELKLFCDYIKLCAFSKRFAAVYFQFAKCKIVPSIYKKKKA